jgi:hypothetical protein
VGKSFRLNMHALMVIANGVPLAMYRESDEMFTLVRSSGTLSFDVPVDQLSEFAHFGHRLLKGSLFLIDSAQHQGQSQTYPTPYLSTLNYSRHFVLAARMHMNLLPSYKHELAAAYHIMSFPSLTQLQYIVDKEVEFIVSKRFTGDAAARVTESLRTLLRYAPLHLVTGCSIGAQCVFLEDIVRKLADVKSTDITQVAEIYRRGTSSMTKSVSDALVPVDDKDIDRYFKNLLRSTPICDIAVRSLSTENATVPINIVAELRHSKSTVSNPAFSLPPTICHSLRRSFCGTA